MSKIGFIGTGIMGAPMAGHLIDGGHEVLTYDVMGVAASLTEKSAKVAGSS